MATRNDFKVFQKEATKMLRGLPKMIGKMALVEASDNFRKQGHENDSGAFVPWAPRKTNKPEHGRTRNDGQRDRRYRVPKGRAILVQSGRLRRSLRIVSSTASSITIGTDVPYAEPLQEGNQHLPARPFLTAGKSFREKVLRKTAADITKLLNR
ncbi:phage virion morphogenesis protein [Hymenobacter sp. YC55]|uniref:phage virion morphogenesis protein n=1 Tax=Hymenobacter sp. YC55 TaxID=3034019 RepID=UPI0023F99785|nr:phage virion morphogenesis protein [Hymenobacter sp. YC55]MDF7809925.1 phage virion morphogenesis protein [Hymenobacter sp. YC55]